jgi:adenylate kinase family enzyme
MPAGPFGAQSERKMQRVLVLGGPGSGKTTFAARLGTVLGLPVVHLDAHFWQAGWRESPRPEWAARVAALAAGDRWVMDGHYAGTLALRARRADAILVLAPPRLTRVVRLVRRGLRDRGRARPDLAPGCAEQVPSWRFLREAWTFEATEVPKTLAVLAGVEAVRPDGTRAPVEVLRSVAQVQRFLAGARAWAADGGTAARQVVGASRPRPPKGDMG